jgi:hypothetical protein
MGHYASEMADYDFTPPKPPPFEKVPLEKQERHLHRSKWMPESAAGAHESYQWAADYDAFNPEASKDFRATAFDKNRDKLRKGRWWLKPVRYIFTGVPRNDDERAKKMVKDHIKFHGEQHEAGRPGQVLRRKVTYGPWEVVDETEEHSEGWY